MLGQHAESGLKSLLPTLLSHRQHVRRLLDSWLGDRVFNGVCDLVLTHLETTYVLPSCQEMGGRASVTTPSKESWLTLQGMLG
jgi:hypothetical protein